ncbi:hypothetical protein RFI_11203 [Reticulomyxa filosa]|uniref:Uncharacterized protein n=1 Tax=Reticulomyxa filosa TaxID=46433 RepID=X6NJ60_RETFI|nr:hypothetical protein RFI_11203 [Reticulomyxa filosa]|eukprot:ETO25933.1 hypothetical protein RFI_11203 [Reticulomyxa filosa]
MVIVFKAISIMQITDNENLTQRNDQRDTHKLWLNYSQYKILFWLIVEIYSFFKNYLNKILHFIFQLQKRIFFKLLQYIKTVLAECFVSKKKYIHFHDWQQANSRKKKIFYGRLNVSNSQKYICNRNILNEIPTIKNALHKSKALNKKNALTISY